MSQAYRRGYWHAVSGAASCLAEYTAGSFGWHDYNEGWKAAQNEARWNAVYAARRKAVTP